VGVTASSERAPSWASALERPWSSLVLAHTRSYGGLTTAFARAAEAHPGVVNICTAPHLCRRARPRRLVILGYGLAVNDSDIASLTASLEIIAKVDAVCANWLFPGDLHLPLAAAAMARSAGLLDQAIILALQPPSIGANILVRAAFETWITGCWALFGGNDAVLGIEKERIRNEKAIVEKNDLPADVLRHLTDQSAVIKDAQDQLLGGDAPTAVKFLQMATDLPPLIKAQTRDHEDADVVVIYDLLYRVHSTNDAHPWKPVGQYLKEKPAGLAVVPYGPWNNPLDAIATMAMYLGLLGRWIDEARGGSDPDWDVRVLNCKAALE
jgi:hypothetical protein